MKCKHKNRCHKKNRLVDWGVGGKHVDWGGQDSPLTPALDQSVLNRAVFWLFFPGTFVSHVHINTVAIFLVGEAAISCLEIQEYLLFSPCPARSNH